MIDYPKTIEEAREYRYNIWAGNPKGLAFVKERCAYKVPVSTLPSHQCYRRDGHGPANLYCKQHAGMIIWQNYNA